MVTRRVNKIAILIFYVYLLVYFPLFSPIASGTPTSPGIVRSFYLNDPNVCLASALQSDPNKKLKHTELQP